MTKITENEVQEIIELRRNCETLLTIAKKYNITGERVRQIVVKYNKTAESPVHVQGKRCGSDKITKRRQAVAEFRLSGMTLEKIAETMGISRHTIVQDCRILQNEGVLPKRTVKE